MKAPLSLTVPGREIAPITEVNLLKEKYCKVGDACIQRGFSDSHLAGKLHSLGADQLLLRGLVHAPEGASLRAVEDLAVGWRESVNAVDFGQLLTWGQGMLPYQELVAVKYLPIGRTVHELKAMATLQQRGGRTFEPVGLLKNSDNNVGTLTQFSDTITTLDNILWQPGVGDEQRESAAAMAGRSLGELHGVMGVTHGDAQPKNVAYDSKTGDIIHMDLDGAYAHNYRGVEVWSRMRDDVETFATYQIQGLGGGCSGRIYHVIH